MNTSEIRKEAREALKGKWLKAACIFLVFYILTFIISFLFNRVDFLGMGYIIYYITCVPLSFGLIISFIKIKRSEEVKVWDFIKDGFSRFKKSWGIQWHTLKKLALHSILGIFICLIIPLILSFIAFTTNTDPSLSAGLGMSGLIVVCFALPALFIWMFPKYLLYVLSYNISYDNPELSSKECVLKSAELMKGNRIKYFKLSFSFIGWILLIIIVCAISISVLSNLLNTTINAGNVSYIKDQIKESLGYLTILPGFSFIIAYMQVATVCFYERLLKNKT